MRGKGMTLLSLAVAALLVGGTSGTAHASEASESSGDTQILSCFILEVLDLSILSGESNSVDCSESSSSKEKVDVKYVK
ncbi:hypothetical protein ACE14D_06795 [Streptomyces sp. Act-28]